MYPDGSSEDHPVVGRVGGFGVFFGDERDTAAYIPLDEEQTNIRGELRASLHALERHRLGERSVICPDCELIVKGVLEWAQRWRRHNWTNTKGPMQHRDLWEQILTITERLGELVKWLHTPLHIEIPRNSRADHLADVGRQKSPLHGQISAHPRCQEEPEEEEWEEEPIEGWEGWEPEADDEAPSQPPPPLAGETATVHTIKTKWEGRADVSPGHPPLSPLWDIAVCTPTQQAKRPRLQTPLHLSLVCMPRPAGEEATPSSQAGAVTPYCVGIMRNTFHTPQSPMTPRVSMRLLDALKLVPMEESRELSLTPRSVESHTSTASTITCSTEGSQCYMP